MAARRIQTSEVAQGIGDLIAALKIEKRTTEAEARAAGYYSSADAAKASGLTLPTAQRKLKAAEQAKIIERIEVALLNGGVGFFYRPLKQGGNSKGNCKGRK